MASHPEGPCQPCPHTRGLLQSLPLLHREPGLLASGHGIHLVAATQHSCGRRGPLLCAAGSLCWGDLRFVESEQGQGDTPHSSGDPRSVHRWLLTVSCVTPQKAR